MSDDRNGTLAHAVRDIVSQIGTFGLACILWTAVFGVVSASLTSPTVVQLWPYLYWTWIGLLSAWVVSSLVTALLRYRFMYRVEATAVEPDDPPGD
jgi:hypothetical protein